MFSISHFNCSISALSAPYSFLSVLARYFPVVGTVILSFATQLVNKHDFAESSDLNWHCSCHHQLLRASTVSTNLLFFCKLKGQHFRGWFVMKLSSFCSVFYQQPQDRLVLEVFHPFFSTVHAIFPSFACIFLYSYASFPTNFWVKLRADLSSIS